MEAVATEAAWRRAHHAERRSNQGLLALALLVVGASVLLTPSSEAVVLFGWTVPPLCIYSNLFGVDCLGCGLTRSFAYMGHGEVSLAFERHVLGPALYILVAAQVPLRAWRLWSGSRAGAA